MWFTVETSYKRVPCDVLEQAADWLQIGLLSLVRTYVPQLHQEADWSRRPVATAQPSAARSLRMSVMWLWSPRTQSETCPKISFKNTQLASEPRPLAAPVPTGAPNSPLHSLKHPEPLRARSLSLSQLRGARRGAAGADGACTGEGEAAGPATGVHPVGRQRRAGRGRVTQFHGPERT